MIAERARWQAPEVLLEVLGISTLVMLLGRAGWCQPVGWLSLAIGLHGAGVFLTRPAGPRRMLINYGFTLWFYWATAWMATALHVPLRSQTLLAWDQAMFGQTPSVALQGMTTPWLTEVMSIFYLSYLVYLHAVLIHALFQTDTFRARLSAPVFAAFVIGFIGYLAIPAQSPRRAFPELYARPLAGGVLTRVNDWITAHAAAAYDVFPSLHVLITLILLTFDWQHCRRRFWTLILPAVLLFFSTIYLRFHYGVDVLVAGVLYGMYLAGRRFFGKL